MLKNIGGLLVLFGFGSIALGFLGMEFRFLSFLESWGPTAGLGIKGGMGVIGAILWFIGHKQEDGEAEE
jgi:hypothetical protein